MSVCGPDQFKGSALVMLNNYQTLYSTQAADLQEILPNDENETFTCSQQLSDANLDQMTWSGINNKHKHHESMAVRVNCLKRNVKHSNMHVII